MALEEELASTLPLTTAGLGPILLFLREDILGAATRWQEKQRLLLACRAMCKSSGGELCPHFKAGAAGQGGCAASLCSARLRCLCPEPAARHLRPAEVLPLLGVLWGWMP